jgi:hypothetical protein
MFVVTWLMRTMVADLFPLMQLLICVPVGLLAGVTFICAFKPQRQMAVYLFETARELKKKQ